MRLTTLPIFLCFLYACGQEPMKDSIPANIDTVQVIEHSFINPDGLSIKTRFNTPIGFKRTSEADDSFGLYLRTLSLKPHGSDVKMYDGSIKSNYGVYHAVVDLEIGKKNLHQCADAIMRLRAEYLWNNQKYNQIHFNFTNGFRVDYSQWMNGKRIAVHGNKTNWVSKYNPSNTYSDFWSYMEIIFNYAGTLSLSKEMKTKEIDAMKIGDVFILGGSPGHAIIIVDMAVNSETNEKVFMLAQSYMPAQELQILQNPLIEGDNPWYSISSDGILNTPEWTFNNSDLKEFVE